METNAVEQRRQFVRAYQSGLWTMTELCERYAVSRPTGYKWVARWAAEGDEGLAERERSPQTCPHRTAEAVAEQLVAARRRYGWGATKLLKVVRTETSRRGVAGAQHRQRDPGAGGTATETADPARQVSSGREPAGDDDAQ